MNSIVHGGYSPWGHKVGLNWETNTFNFLEDQKKYEMIALETLNEKSFIFLNCIWWLEM